MIAEARAELEQEAPGPGETLDAICDGTVRVLQRADGYRFNLDPILLAHFAQEAGRGLKGPAVDLGTGSGIIPLLLARKFGKADLTAVEIQPSLYALASRNLRLNGCEGRIRLVHADLRRAGERLGRGVYAHVLSNPPYGEVRGGRLNPDRERAIARHEVLCSVDDLARAASELLVDGGSAWLVYPAARLVDLVSALRAHHLRPRRLQTVHPRAGAKARLVLLQALKRRRCALTVCPPLVVHDPAGGYAAEVARMIARY